MIYDGHGYRLVSVPYLRPRLERERPRDRSCINLSAVARNKARLDDASKAYVDKSARTIYGPPHVIAAIMQRLGA